VICWRCTRPVAEDLAVCPHCPPVSSQKAPVGSNEDEIQVSERGGEIQSFARWESAAPATYQQVTVPMPRETRFVWAGFIAIFIGMLSFLGGAGGIVFGLFCIVCGITTLAITRFGARWIILPWWQKALAYPAWIISWVFMQAFRVAGFLFKVFTRNS